MAHKRNADMIELKIQLNADEEKRFLSYVERNKFKSHRQAFVHLLGLAENKDNNGVEEEKPEEPAIESPKQDNAKKGKGRKGKKGAEQAAMEVEMPVKTDTNGRESDDEVLALAAAKGEDAKKEDGKKGKGRKGKKANEEPAAEPVAEETKEGNQGQEHAAKEEPKKGKGRGRAKKAAEVAAPMEEEVITANGEKADADEKEEPEAKPMKQAAAANKKGGRGRKGKEDSPDVAAKSDATFVVPAGDMPAKEATTKPEPSKKGRRGGKKAAAEPIAEEHGDGDAETNGTTSSRPKRSRPAKGNKNYAESEDVE